MLTENININEIFFIYLFSIHSFKNSHRFPTNVMVGFIYGFIVPVTSNSKLGTTPPHNATQLTNLIPGLHSPTPCSCFLWLADPYSTPSHGLSLAGLRVGPCKAPGRMLRNMYMRSTCNSRKYSECKGPTRTQSDAHWTSPENSHCE